LQIVKLLVGQLDGTIELRREGGTEFRIVFPELKYKPRV
jgi:two-component sensor histidine kinase